MPGPTNSNPPSCPPATACNCGTNVNSYYFQESSCSFTNWQCNLLTGGPTSWNFSGGAYALSMTCSGGEYTVGVGYANVFCGDALGGGTVTFRFRPQEGQCKFRWDGKMSTAIRPTCARCGGLFLQVTIKHSSFGCP